MQMLKLAVTAPSMMVGPNGPIPAGSMSYVGPAPPNLSIPMNGQNVGGAQILTVGPKVGNAWYGVTFLAPGATIPGMGNLELS